MRGERITKESIPLAQKCNACIARVCVSDPRTVTKWQITFCFPVSFRLHQRVLRILSYSYVSAYSWRLSHLANLEAVRPPNRGLIRRARPWRRAWRCQPTVAVGLSTSAAVIHVRLGTV